MTLFGVLDDVADQYGYSVLLSTSKERQTRRVLMARRVEGVTVTARLRGYREALLAAGAVPLTTMRRPVADIGAVAVRLLQERMSDPHGAARQIIIPSPLVVRRSCGAA